MEQIIKKAIEGGYMFTDIMDGYELSCRTECIYYKTFEGEDKYIPYEVILMNPLFWQSLGKACEWEKNTCPHLGMCCGKCPLMDIPEWQSKAIRFYEINLTEGWDAAVAYLESITK